MWLWCNKVCVSTEQQLITTARTETNMEYQTGSLSAVRHKTSRAAVHTTTHLEQENFYKNTMWWWMCRWARSASVYCYVRSSGRTATGSSLSAPLPGPASRSGQLADTSHPPRGRTFVIHRCGLLRGPRDIGLSGTRSILSWPCFRLRLDTSLFLSFLLLWRWLRHQLFICGVTHAQLQLCARAPPAGGDG